MRKMLVVMTYLLVCISCGAIFCGVDEHETAQAQATVAQLTNQQLTSGLKVAKLKSVDHYDGFFATGYSGVSYFLNVDDLILTNVSPSAAGGDVGFFTFDFSQIPKLITADGGIDWTKIKGVSVTLFPAGQEDLGCWTGYKPVIYIKPWYTERSDYDSWGDCTCNYLAVTPDDCTPQGCYVIKHIVYGPGFDPTFALINKGLYYGTSDSKTFLAGLKLRDEMSPLLKDNPLLGFEVGGKCVSEQGGEYGFVHEPFRDHYYLQFIDGHDANKAPTLTITY